MFFTKFVAFIHFTHICSHWISKMAGSMDNFEVIDGHLHVYDLKLKASFPNQNWTIVDFPDKENESAIYMDITQEYAKEIANKSGVKKVVMVMCFDDCPEEAQWVMIFLLRPFINDVTPILPHPSFFHSIHAMKLS